MAGITQEEGANRAVVIEKLIEFAIRNLTFAPFAAAAEKNHDPELIMKVLKNYKKDEKRMLDLVLSTIARLQKDYVMAAGAGCTIQMTREKVKQIMLSEIAHLRAVYNKILKSEKEEKIWMN